MTLCTVTGCLEEIEYKYHQLNSMCAKYYFKVIGELELILGHPITCHSHLLSDMSDKGNQDIRISWDD